MVSNPNIDANLVSKFFNPSSKNNDFIEILETVIKEYKSKENSTNVPISIFANRQLGILETLVKYLKEVNITYHEIAVMLNRNDRTIWTTYAKACKKEKERLRVTDSITINPKIFSNREQAPLEALIKHLKDRGMTLKQISISLNRSYKTIWLTDNKKR